MAAEKVTKRIGKVIREKRKKLGLTQEKLGERAGLHYSYIGQIERGDKNPSLRALEKLARALDTPLESFFEERESYQTSQGEELIEELKKMLLRRRPEEIRLAFRLVEALLHALDEK